MNIELLTKEDIGELLSAFKVLQSDLSAVKAKLFATENTTLSGPEICERLRISENTFRLRREKLCHFGMWKDGQWKMKSADLDKYIEHTKSN